MKIFKKGGKCLNRGPQNFVGPPWGPNFKVLGIIWCGYSKLVSQDAWHNAKGISSIWPPCPEKTSKMWSDFVVSKYPNISEHFGSFLWTGWSDWADSFCIVPGVSRHKFRVPTSYNSDNFEIWTLRGANKILGGPVEALSPFFENFRFLQSSSNI